MNYHIFISFYPNFLLKTMSNTKNLFGSLLLVLIWINGLAQVPSINDVNILSPKAASIMKFGDHPVSLHTGLIDTSVPIYTIEGDGLAVPISLKYHASGMKYDDVSNEIGLGWTLMAGGVITRSYAGAQDGLYETYSRDVTTFTTCSSTSSSLDNDYVRIREVDNGARNNGAISQRMDGEMDMYSFSFLNHSGSFCFPFSDSQVGTTLSAPSTGLFIPANGLQVVDRNNLNTQILLLDTDGVSYKFEVKDVDQNTAFKEYYLTQVISASKAETIEFLYEVVSSLSNYYVRRPYINYTTSVITTAKVYTGHIPASQGPDIVESGGIYYQSLRPPRLTRINFSSGYVLFKYASATTWDLQQIEIFDNTQSAPLQIISLAKSLFSNAEQRLDAVTFENAEGQTYDYKFGYNGEPMNINAAGSFLKGIDYWGYFNGASVPHAKCYNPTFANMPDGMNGMDRSASEYYMQQGMLNKITYPSKGYSEFTFEAHKARYSLGTSIVTFGGVRIRQIKSYSADGTLAQEKNYVYGENESGYGLANNYPDIRDFSTNSKTLITHATDDTSPHFCQVRSTTTYSSFPKLSYSMSGGTVVYPQVTEYISGTSGQEGKTVYRYEVFTDQELPSYGNTYRSDSPNCYQRTYPWKTGNLISKSVYKSGSSQPIYRLQNTYTDINVSEFRNFRILPCVEFEYNFESGANYSIPDIKSNFCNYEDYRAYFGGTAGQTELSPYDYFNYYTNTGQRVLSSTEETSDEVTTRTEYITYNDIGLPKELKRWGSKNEEIKTTLKYASDYSYSPYTSMKSANIVTPVIEKSIYNNGILLNKEISNFGYFHSTFFAPLSLELQHGLLSPEVRAVYDYDPSHNLRELTTDGQFKSVYLWGYNKRHPIGKIKNASYDEVKNILGQALIDRVANASIPASSDLNAINDLRTNAALKNAQITTYTYRPLIGMTSQTDVNGRTTFYEYDSFGRLTYIKDHDGNVLQLFEYHYKQ